MANEGHNVGDLNKAIRECATQMGEINTERKELNERAGDIRERLRKLGVETKAFDFAVRLQGMEQEARANYLDSLRINFDALSIGAQSEMFQEAADVAGNGEDKSAKAKKPAKAKAKAKAKKAAKTAEATATA
jgi:uncharacterized coiled-coil DUF342 family protein